LSPGVLGGALGCPAGRELPYGPPDARHRLEAAVRRLHPYLRELIAQTQTSDSLLRDVVCRNVRGRPRSAERSDMAGRAIYGYCACHSRWFWGLRLYLICTPAGMPILRALADPNIGEREVLAAMPGVEPRLAASRPRLILTTDKGFAGQQTEADLAASGITLLRPARKNEAACPGEALLKTIRQLIESVNDTLKGQLDLEAHGGRTFEGVAIRVAQRVLAMAAAIWHNNKTGQPVTRSLTRLRPLNHKESLV
jgi:hypothetical protein